MKMKETQAPIDTENEQEQKESQQHGEEDQVPLKKFPKVNQRIDAQVLDINAIQPEIFAHTVASIILSDPQEKQIK